MEHIVGRHAELGRVTELAAAGGAGVLVLVGDPGLGKTTLARHAMSTARDAGRTVLTARGAVGERELAFGALHQLLRPCLDRLDRLPRPQRRAVGGAFGLLDDAPVPDRLHLAAGVLTLVSDLPEPGALVVVDDLQWFDDASRDVVLFCARRLVDGDGRTGLLLATRPEAAPAGLPALELAPLGDQDAGRLLDRQPAPPAAHERPAVLHHAAGNPLALVELSRPGATPAGTTGDGTGADAVTARVQRAFAARLPALPPETRHALLLAAAADADDLSVVLAAARPAGDPDDVPDDARAAADALITWAPAEEAGLVHLDGDRVRFRHPLARGAVYDSAPLAARRGAHLALAEASPDPDRHAWHLAAAAVGPDGDAAAALEATADRARERGGWVAAARALERAGDLSPDPGAATRRYLLAAPAAMFTGRTAWVERLAARAGVTATDEPARLEADLYAGWAIASTNRHADAVGRLTALARRVADVDPGLAVAALTPAAVAAYNAGDDALLDDVGDALAAAGSAELVDDDPAVAWVLGSVAPFDPASRAALDRALRVHGELGIRELNVLGGAAWVLDETRLAERLLGRLLDLFADGPTEGTNALVSSTLAYARLELGRWDDAQAGAEDAIRVAEETGMPVVRAAAQVTTAQLAAYRGRTDEARSLARAALEALDPDITRAVGVRARLTLGLAALADGDPEGAYDLLRRGFDDDGAPVHRHSSVHSLAMLAGAAVRSDRAADAARVVEAAAAHVGAEPGPRVTAIVHHARALLSGGDDAERHYRAALADPASATWPFERALVRLDLGERLRRSRQVSRARTELSAALETFLRLGAAPFAERATAELRAAGVKVADRVPDPLAALTPQQRRIVHLAAQGRTNREIAEHLFLSPRTVGFHLYRVFPVLGVSSRAQLRDVVEAGRS
ncbi:LuxR family transcriptional regulator [Isoptericola hypogeus]|uniref:LuxR family transcriptional regulator n=1 Tax=Isoptericola hypogeus TaxID=300179 RepID=A0ABN2J2W0_9MICO